MFHAFISTSVGVDRSIAPSMSTAGPLAVMAGRFTWVDWLVVVATLAFTTWLGAKKAGKQATIREFFLGGRRLPWWAVCGSIVATEISALTFVSVPWVVFQPGGNITYLQLGLIGSVLARIIVGYWLVPAYYQREIYSPYDYMGARLGGHVRTVTTTLFVIGGLLGQATRVYLTALVLRVVMHDELTGLAARFGGNDLIWAIGLMAAVSIGWTLMGGMTTVIWTDVMLCLAFYAGAIIALGTIIWNLEGGLGQLIREGWSATVSGVPWGTGWGAPRPSGPWGKFTLFEFSTSPIKNYTIWTALIAATWTNVGLFGTDQLMAQRMFCCQSQRDARKAIIGSAVSICLTILVSIVGIGLFVYYQHHAPGAEALALLNGQPDERPIFPVFIVEVVPVGLKGLILAAIFAAAISSVMGVLTALSQTVMTAFYNPLRERALARRGVAATLSGNIELLAEQGGGDAESRRSVLVGRLLVVFWGLALSATAYGTQFAAAKHKALLDVGLAFAGYAGGGLLAGFVLAFLPLKIDDRGYRWSAPLSLLTIFSLAWHCDTHLDWYRDWTVWVCVVGCGTLLVTWLLFAVRLGGRVAAKPVLPVALQTLVLVTGLVGVFWLNRHGHWGRLSDDALGNPRFMVLAWPWYVPVGSVVATGWGYLLARRREASDAPSS